MGQVLHGSATTTEGTGIDAHAQSLSDLIEGRLSSPAGREALVKLATRLIVEEALEDILYFDPYEAWR